MKGLWESLARAGDHFNGNGGIEQSEDKKKSTIILYMGSAATSRVKEAAAAYSRSYLRECGWSVRGISFDGSAMKITVTPRK